MRPLSYPPALPEAWLQVLNKVEETLRQIEAAAAQREQASCAVPPSSPTDEQQRAQWEHGLQRLQERIQAWPVALQQAKNESAEADAALKDTEEAVRHWLSQAAELEQKLAKWGDPEVS
jgi:hypothetical protein